MVCPKCCLYYLITTAGKIEFFAVQDINVLSKSTEAAMDLEAFQSVVPTSPTHYIVTELQ
jgi:hypothetical protein